jgi:monothiol glutaredoxin
LVPRVSTAREGFAARLLQLRFSAQPPSGILNPSMDINERIKGTLEGHPIVLYMKGTPQFPMCGFSARTVQALNAAGAEFFSVNVLEDPEIRANLPRYSNWPTFPQLYINGELIGGCDITLELYQSGELQRMVQEAKAAQ